MTEGEIKPIFKDANPRFDDEDFKRFLDYLEDEFYIVKEDDKYKFSNNVMRDWWIRYYQLLETFEGVPHAAGTL